MICANANMKEEAESFFQKYNRDFDSWDMKTFSQLFNEPFISVRPNGTVISMPTNEQAEVFFEGALKQWKKEGYRYFSTKDYAVTAIGEKSMLVTLTWELLRADREVIREWRQSYNLLKANGEWKVLTSTFHAD